MKAKLIKVLEHYHLYDGDKAMATSIVGNPMLLPNLSIKNCEAIELGYDLDELVKREYLEGYDTTNLCRLTFKDGFKKALEILGDKKFSEDDVNLAFVLGKNKDESRINKLINSKLQQTEWDVEIVTTTRMENGKSGLDVPVEKPKLDADGCLILSLI